MKSILWAVAALFLFTACNKNDVITNDNPPKPIITLDNAYGIYQVKTGKSVTISPTVEYAGDAAYSWILDGRTVGSDPTYTYQAATAGSFYLVFRVENSGGTAEEELRIDVSDVLPPVISFAVGEDRVMTVESNREHQIAPVIANSENATFLWTLDGQAVGSEATYTFIQSHPGDYPLTLRAENEDGVDEQEITVRVVARYQGVVTFPAASYTPEGITTKTVSLGRTLYLQPVTDHFQSPVYEWTIDGTKVPETATSILAFTPEQEGEYTVQATAADDNGAAGSGQVRVICCKPEGSYKREASGASSKRWNKVYEYTAAPGQFINGAGFENVTTPQQAAIYAQEQLAANNYVSLGGWGGYIVTGFDHSIENKGSYDFSVMGNQFDGSSEPGIVWVMQDTNGNGQPDDEWYELKGSEYGKSGTIQNYAVTYYRPAGPRMSVQWTDNRGSKGEIASNKFHRQDYYYPLWINEQSYTLYGTCLAPNSVIDPLTGLYVNNGYERGYADNAGTDRDNGDNATAAAQKVYFKISNAVNADGSQANLQYIDFIKIQTGINYVAGHLGEISTEVCGFEDENL